MPKQMLTPAEVQQDLSERLPGCSVELSQPDPVNAPGDWSIVIKPKTA